MKNIQCFFFQTHTWMPKVTDNPWAGGVSTPAAPSSSETTRNGTQRPAGPSRRGTGPHHGSATASQPLPVPHSPLQPASPHTTAAPTTWPALCSLAGQRCLRSCHGSFAGLQGSSADRQAAVEAVRECAGREEPPFSTAVDLHSGMEPNSVVSSCLWIFQTHTNVSFLLHMPRMSCQAMGCCCL